MTLSVTVNEKPDEFHTGGRRSSTAEPNDGSGSSTTTGSSALTVKGEACAKKETV